MSHRLLMGVARRIAIGGLVIASFPPPAIAAWPENTYLDLGGVGSQRVKEAYLTPGSTAGHYFAWYYHVATSGHWAAQSFTSDGVALWPGAARALDGEISGLWSGDLGLGFSGTGDGGFLHLFRTGSSSPNALRVQRVDAAGNVVPSSPPFGSMLDTLISTPYPAAAPADGGGAWCAWYRGGVRLVRVDASGALVSPWPVRGWRPPGTSFGGFTPPALLADGSGGVLLLASNDVLRLQRIDADMTTAAGWPAEGLSMSTAVVGSGARLTLLPSDASHALALWCEGASALRIVCQRVSLAGAPDPAWPAAGVEIRAGIDPSTWSGALFRCIPDGSGGVTVAWAEDTLYYARHLGSDGSFLPGYQSAPRVILHASDQYLYSTYKFGAGVCAGRAGGLCTIWRRGDGVRGRWLDGNGDPDPSPALSECEVRSLSEMSSQGYEIVQVDAALADGDGGAYVLAFGQAPSSVSPTGSAFLTHVTQRSIAGVTPPAGSHGLVLEVAPNPAHGALTARLVLPDARDASLGLYDSAGRRLRTVRLQGAGPHTARFDRLGGLSPGLYWVRLSQGSRARAVRIALMK